MRHWMPMRALMRLVIGALSGAGVVLIGAGGALAAESYGAPGPVPPAPPGGYFSVVTSQTITPAGGTIGPVTVNGLLVTLKIPAGAFPVALQVTLTAPDAAAIGNAGFHGYEAVGGVGILVQENGATYTKVFRSALDLSMSSPSISRSSRLVDWDGRAFVKAQDATDRSGVATVHIISDRDSDFAVLDRDGNLLGSSRATLSAAAVKPLLNDELLSPLGTSQDRLVCLLQPAACAGAPLTK